MASSGTVRPLSCTCVTTRTLTNMPGHSLRSGLGKIALRVIVPEVVFAWLSIAASVPVSSSVLPSALHAMALTVPFAIASCTQCKHRADVLHLVDDDQGVRLARRAPGRARVNDVADIEQANSGDPVER